MANQSARQDQNHFPGFIAHSGTAEDSETRRVTSSNVNSKEALDVVIQSGTVEASNSGTTVEIDKISPVISTNNSTSSILGGGGTFTGTGEDVSQYASIKISILTDEDSDTDGFSVEFSSDNSNWDISYNFSITADKQWVGEFGPEAQYFRVVYTNGGIFQGFFRLQTIFHPISTQKIGIPVESSINPESSAQLVRSVISGKNPSNDYVNINTTTAGNFKVSVEEFGSGANLPGGTLDAGTVDVLGTVPVLEQNLDAEGNINQSSHLKGYDSTGGTWVPLAADSGGTLQISLEEKTHYFEVVCFDFTTDVATGDGKGYLHIPPKVDNNNLTYAHGRVITAGTTNTTDIQIHNVTEGVDMLTNKITIDSAETGSDTAATPVSINTSNDDVNENDLIRLDVDSISNTPPKGLIITLGFEKA